MWDCVLSVLVIFHLVTEYVHYAYEYCSGNREKNILVDMQRHRMRSKKTEMLKKIQKDLDLIKEKLGIEDGKKPIEVSFKIKQYGLGEKEVKKCDVCGERWSPRHFFSCKGKAND